jgi:hypothetical protein
MMLLNHKIRAVGTTSFLVAAHFLIDSAND